MIPIVVLALVATIANPVHGSATSEGSATPGGAVNIYSHRHYEVDERLYASFEAKTGIRVNVVQAEANELMERLRSEGSRSPADLLITEDAGRLLRAVELGLLQGVSSAKLEAAVPAALRDPLGRWYGLTQRARVIVYSRARVKPDELSTYEDLASPRWRGRILVRSSSNIYNQSLLAWMIAARGEEAASRWAAGLVANFARQPKGSDRDQVAAIAAGEGDVALLNTYYVGLLAASPNPGERRAAESVGVHFPPETHVNVSGAGVTVGAPHRDNALRLLEFLVSEDAQAVFAGANYEYPVNRAVSVSPLLASWGPLPASPVPLANMSRWYERAQRIFDEAGWR